MFRSLCLLVLVLVNSAVAAQGFVFTTHRPRVVIPFKLMSNLIIIPIHVNGVELNFLVDSGVNETILFSLDDKQELKLYNVARIALRGLGNAESVEGLKSTNNTLTVSGLEMKNHNILVVIDDSMNFSASLGIPVNGIIGNSFFEDNIVEVNYSKKKIYIHHPERARLQKRLRRFKSMDISLEKGKPYVESVVLINRDTIAAKLLIDTGNSDAIWLFPARKAEVVVPARNFHDFLGRGFNGEIFGRKGRIEEFELGGYKFEQPIVAFPDSASFRNLKMAENRLGSVGGELLKRFVLIFNYREHMFYMKKDSHFNLPFFYNISGIELHHDGLKLVHEEYRNKELKKGVTIQYGEVQHDLQYRFELKPAYKIASIRPESPAARAGLQKDDKLMSINGIPAHRHSLQELNEMLKQKPGTVLKLGIERNDKTLQVEVLLEDVL